MWVPNISVVNLLNCLYDYCIYLFSSISNKRCVDISEKVYGTVPSEYRHPAAYDVENKILARITASKRLEDFSL